jgi:uracil-DNA glycosylase family 4
MDALALLRLQIEWGADEALSETPVDRLRPRGETAAERPRPPQAVSAPPAPLAPVTTAPFTAAERATAAAADAHSLPALRQAIAAFDGCALRQTASHLVFAEGEANGGLLLIGDPPGEEEDRTGQVFAGAEGALLDSMLASIGLTRAQALLAPLIPWRPPGGRAANAGELAACLPFLHRLIVLAAPRHVVLLGGQAARALLSGRPRVARWTELAGAWGRVRTLVLPAPGTLLKTPAQRPNAWAGLRLLRRGLDDRSSPPP